MKAWIGRIVFVFLTAGVVWSIGSNALLSQTLGGKPAVATESQGEPLQIVSSMLPTGTQQIVVLDGSARSMAVYHIDAAQGKIQLKSVRNLAWDLRMEHFNGQVPLPSELRQVEP
jgi:hypothetical protein